MNKHTFNDNKAFTSQQILHHASHKQKTVPGRMNSVIISSCKLILTCEALTRLHMCMVWGGYVKVCIIRTGTHTFTCEEQRNVHLKRETEAILAIGAIFICFTYQPAMGITIQ